MNCQICGREDAYIRKTEIPTALITHRAHVDCGGGHSQYRWLSLEEIISITDDTRERDRLLKIISTRGG